MPINRRKFIYSSAVATVITTLPKFCFAEVKNAITVWGPPAIPSILLSVLAQRNKDASQEVKFELYKGADMLRAGLASNSMPLLLMPTYVAANFYNRGKNLKLLDLVSNGFFYVMSRDKSIHNIEDLSGKKVAIFHQKNTMPDIILRVLLRAAKIEDKVELIYFSSSTETMAMFLNKKFDTTLISEPQASVIASKSKMVDDTVYLSIDIQEEWGRLLNTAPSIPMVSLVVDEGFYRENESLIQMLRSDLSSTVNWVNDNTSEAAKYGVNIWHNLSTDIIKEAIHHANLTFKSPSESKENILFYYEQLLALNPKVVGGKMPNGDLFKI